MHRLYEDPLPKATEKGWCPKAQWISRATLLIGMAACTALAGRPPCPSCRIEEVRLSLPDGISIFGRLYLPTDMTNLPAVVVAHGYLGNSGFLEVPWAADLTHLGVAALFVDRRGHGRSGGSWYPPAANGGVRLQNLYLDLHAAVAFLRQRAPLIDPTRIGLVGHSDGGTGAMMVASADWDVAATVALSASAAPWEYVNYVAPHNLLLLYGGEDHFILSETDHLLMQQATRGYLDGEGEIGNRRDGSARRLVRVPGFGHVDLVYSTEARRETLQWLADTFALPAPVVLSPSPIAWFSIGTAVLVLALLLWNGLPAKPIPVQARHRLLVTSMVVSSWAVGLAIAGRVGPQLQNLPVQEGGIVFAVLVGESLLMGSIALGATAWMKTAPVVRIRGSDIGRGVLAALVVQLAWELLLRPVYATPVSSARLILFGLFLPPSLAAFAAAGRAGILAAGSAGQVIRGVSIETVLAVLTAILTPQLFVRMAMLPVLLLALALLMAGAYRAGGRSAAATAAFGAVIFARNASLICAWY